MITLLIGKKGSGKTKKLIELANEAVQNSNGNVVVIEKGLKLTYDISHKARLVDSDAYGIEGLDALVGFVSGICAANYDVTDVFVDSTLKITGKGVEEVEPLTAKLKTLSESSNVNICLLISADAEELPASVREVISASKSFCTARNSNEKPCKNEKSNSVSAETTRRTLFFAA